MHTQVTAGPTGALLTISLPLEHQLREDRASDLPTEHRACKAVGSGMAVE